MRINNTSRWHSGPYPPHLTGYWPMVITRVISQPAAGIGNEAVAATAAAVQAEQIQDGASTNHNMCDLALEDWVDAGPKRSEAKDAMRAIWRLGTAH